MMLSLLRSRLRHKRNGWLRPYHWERNISPYDRSEFRWVTTYIGPTVELTRTNEETGREYTLAVQCCLHGAYNASGEHYLYAEGWVRAGHRNVFRLVRLTDEESEYCVRELGE